MAPSEGVGESSGETAFCCDSGGVGSNSPSYGSIASVHGLRWSPRGRRRSASAWRLRMIRSPSATSLRWIASSILA
eukprot:6179332-Pleurochrysis_carterae.AAC.3